MNTRKLLRFILCAVLSVALLLTMSGAVFAEEDWTVDDTTVTDEEEITVRSYEQVAQSGNLTMFAEKETGEFYLKDSVSGKQWHSTPVDVDQDEKTKGLQRTNIRSQILISYINREEMALTEYDIDANNASDATTTVQTIANGIRVTYVFEFLGFEIPVEYTLQDGKFFATIDPDDIKETAEYMLININLLPVFGAGNWAQEGYLLVPDGSGALVEFNNGVQLASNYEAMVYGEEMAYAPEKSVTYTEAIRLPVFGTVTNGSALMGVITQGDATSSITVINGNERCGYNAISSIFHYRTMQSQYNLFNKRKVNLVAELPYGLDTYEVCYSTLNGEDADYIGIANAYREYLIKEKGLTKKDTTPTFHLDAMGAFEQDATFLGIIPYTKKVALTTYKECEEILAGLKGAGITNISLRYKGWSNNGLKNVKVPKAATPLSALGGKKGFASLQEYAKAEGINFVPDVDLLTFQKSGNGVSIGNSSIRTVFGKTVYHSEYILSNYVTRLKTSVTAILSPEQISTVGQKYLKSLQKQNLSGVSLSNLGEYCYTNFYEKNQQERAMFPTHVENVLKEYREAGVRMTFDGGNAYVLPYADLITNVPTHSSGYDIFSQDVPFYQAVLHGYVPYTTESIPQSADPLLTYLSAAETGSELLYVGFHEDSSVLFDTSYTNLYGSTWTLWKDEAAQHYKEYMPLLTKVHDQTMTEHRQVEDGVFVTGYANGVSIAVNYTDADVTVEGNTVPAKGICEWKEGAA